MNKNVDMPILISQEEIESANYKYSRDSNVNHCSFCEKIGVTLFGESKNLDDLGGHCFNKQHLDDVNKYLAYRLCESHETVKKRTLHPAITINAKYEMECKKIDAKQSINAHEVIMSMWDNYNCFLVSGETGIGKRTFLKKLVYGISLHGIKNKSDIIIPVVLNCNEYSLQYTEPKEWFVKKLNEEFPKLKFDDIINAKKYRIVIILNSINNIAYSDYSDFKKRIDGWAKFVSNLTETNSNVRFVISSENVPLIVGAESCFKKLDWVQLYIQPLTLDQVNELINVSSLNPSDKEKLIKLVENNFELPFLKLPFFVDRIIKSAKTITSVSDKSSFITYYLDCTINNASFSKEELISFLSTMAYELATKKSFQADSFCNAKGKIRNDNIALILDYCVNSLLLTCIEEKYTFSDNTFLYYFLSLYIKHNIWNKTSKLNEILLFQTRYENTEIIKHLYNIVNDKNVFFNWLVNSDLLYATNCIVENPNNNKNDIAKRIICTLEKQTNNLNDSEKQELGLLLGRIGDLRFLENPDKTYIEPIMYAVPTMKGIKVAVYPVTNLEYKYFLNDPNYLDLKYWPEAVKDDWFSKETICKSVYEHWIKVQSQLRKDPQQLKNLCSIRNFNKKQCACLYYFLDIPKERLKKMIDELYGNEKKNTVPSMLNNPEYNNPSMPVVGVSIYEAFAYCKWLSEKTSKHYRLLSSEEWDKLACSSSRKYSYGNKYNPHFCNTIESSWGAILPVGIIAENRTQNGHMDISGNTFEWTNTIYSLGSSESSGIDTQYICKGGSWIQDSKRAISSYIGRGKSWVKNIDVGFRVCCDDN